MLKASRALLRVAAIVGTICAALLLAFVPVFFVFGFSSTIRDMVVQEINDGNISYQGDGLSPEQFVLIFQIMFVALGFTFLILGAMCLVNAIISVRTRREPTRGRYIACIVTGALSTDFSMIAAILGLICLKKQERQNKLEE